MKKNNKKKGFTLVELVIVIAVIAILAGVMIATFSNVVGDAKDSAALQEARSLVNAAYVNFLNAEKTDPKYMTFTVSENGKLTTVTFCTAAEASTTEDTTYYKLETYGTIVLTDNLYLVWEENGFSVETGTPADGAATVETTEVASSPVTSQPSEGGDPSVD